ncbi:hypothetical protein [Streptomyces antimycoticus]|uniref:hypothetical protein n=1 Tax=Streptomyces antimycoticus TaxID=68175 RepID=UPI0033C1E3D4
MPTTVAGPATVVVTSIPAVHRRVGPTSTPRLLQRDERARLYHIDPALVEGLRRAFAIADARPDLLRGEPTVRVT